MEAVIFLAWFGLVWGIPIALIVSGYKVHIEGAKKIDIFAKLTFGFIVHLVLTAAMFPLMFIMIFAGAHTEPIGDALTVGGKLFYISAVSFHAVVGWLLCSFINGRLIRPWLLLYPTMNRPISIFDDQRA